MYVDVIFNRYSVLNLYNAKRLIILLHFTPEKYEWNRIRYVFYTDFNAVELRLHKFILVKDTNRYYAIFNRLLSYYMDVIS